MIFPESVRYQRLRRFILASHPKINCPAWRTEGVVLPA
jgi:hypothetical protein